MNQQLVSTIQIDTHFTFIWLNKWPAGKETASKINMLCYISCYVLFFGLAWITIWIKYGILNTSRLEKVCIKINMLHIGDYRARSSAPHCNFFLQFLYRLLMAKILFLYFHFYNTGEELGRFLLFFYSCCSLGCPPYYLLASVPCIFQWVHWVHPSAGREQVLSQVLHDQSILYHHRMLYIILTGLLIITALFQIVAR